MKVRCSSRLPLSRTCVSWFWAARRACSRCQRLSLPLCAAGLSDLSGRPTPREYAHPGGPLQSSGGRGREKSTVHCHGGGNTCDRLPQCIEPLKQWGKFSDILFTSWVPWVKTTWEPFLCSIQLRRFSKKFLKIQDFVCSFLNISPLLILALQAKIAR